MNTISTEKCSSCGKSVAAYDGVSTGGSEDSRPLCCRCFNEMIAERMGLDFDHPHFEDTIPGLVNHRTETVYLAGLPDIPESRPHSAVNSWGFRG